MYKLIINTFSYECDELRYSSDLHSVDRPTKKYSINIVLLLLFFFTTFCVLSIIIILMYCIFYVYT